jgi:hypothetical protein
MNRAPVPLQDLSAHNPPPRSVWQWAILSFLVSAALALAIVALTQPFHRGADSQLSAYEAGFQDGLMRGTESAHLNKAELGAIAYRRGRQAGRAEAEAHASNRFAVGPGARSGSIWLHATVADLTARSTARAATSHVSPQNTAAYQRGYRDGYAGESDGER